MARVGVCLFDDPKSLAGGWAARSGEPAFRTNATGALASDTLWVTNLDFPVYRRLNLGQTPHIYDGQYFRTSVRQLIIELGLEDDPQEAARVLSSLLERLVREAARLFGINLSQPGYRFATLLGSAMQGAVLRRMPRGQHAAQLREALQEATQQNQSVVGVQAPFGSALKAFLLPRGAHAKYLLRQHVPSGERWQALSVKRVATSFGHAEGQTVRGTRAIRDRLAAMAQDKAVFLRIRVLETDPFYRSFATFGAGSNQPRHWAVAEEVLHLSRFARVEILDGFACPRVALELPEALSLDEPEYSISRSLLLENLWVGLLTPLNSQRIPSAAAAYLRAIDRLLCARAAEAMVQEGFPVGSYGTGRVMIYVRAAEQARVAEAAMANHLQPPLGIARAGVEGA